MKNPKYFCRQCGAEFGADDRAFEVGTMTPGARDWLCYVCLHGEGYLKELANKKIQYDL